MRLIDSVETNPSTRSPLGASLSAPVVPGSPSASTSPVPQLTVGVGQTGHLMFSAFCTNGNNPSSQFIVKLETNNPEMPFESFYHTDVEADRGAKIPLPGPKTGAVGYDYFIKVYDSMDANHVTTDFPSSNKWIFDQADTPHLLGNIEYYKPVITGPAGNEGVVVIIMNNF